MDQLASCPPGMETAMVFFFSIFFFLGPGMRAISSMTFHKRQCAISNGKVRVHGTGGHCAIDRLSHLTHGIGKTKKERGTK